MTSVIWKAITRLKRRTKGRDRGTGYACHILGRQFAGFFMVFFLTDFDYLGFAKWGYLAVEVWADPVYNNIGLEYTGPGGTETLAGLPDSGRAPCGMRTAWAKLWQNELQFFDLRVNR